MMENSEEHTDISEQNNKQDQNIDREMDFRVNSVIKEKFTSLKDCIFSLPFVLVCLWFTSSLLRFTFFLSQLGQQLKFLFASMKQTADTIQVTSSILLMCGIIFSPISGAINDTARRINQNQLNLKMSNKLERISNDQVYYSHLHGLIPGLLASAIACLVVSGLIFIPRKEAIYTAIIVCVILRSLLFSCLVLFIMTAFPIDHFGTLNGLVSTIAGLLSLVQYGLLELHPTTANIIMCVFAIIMFITPAVLFFMKRQ